MEAALAAGAHGCYLSGAGPTVLAITSGAAGDSFTQSSSERCERAVADAMQKAADAFVAASLQRRRQCKDPPPSAP